MAQIEDQTANKNHLVCKNLKGTTILILHPTLNTL